MDHGTGVRLGSGLDSLPEAALEDLIGQVRALDMDEARQAVAANRARV